MSAFVDEIKNADIKSIVDSYNYAEKIARAKKLLEWAYNEYGDKAVVANSLGKDSMVVWDLALKVNPKARGFIVTTKFKPQETKDYMKELMAVSPGLQVFESNAEVGTLYETDPDKCCQMLKVEPTRQAVEEMGVDLWITGLRCTEGETRVDFKEIEERDENLLKLNPILLLKEREVWQYLALNQVKTNQLYAQGYRSLGCSPCTHISSDDNERAGRWLNTPKRGGECGIHTRPLKNWEVVDKV